MNVLLLSLLPRRWFQVTSSHVAHVPPVVHACETIESKNREIVQMLADPLDQPIQKLSLSLQGVIDAAVNGGIAKYQEAFFSTEFLRENPERGDDVARLQRIMHEQVGRHLCQAHCAQIEFGKKQRLWSGKKSIKQLNSIKVKN